MNKIISFTIYLLLLSNIGVCQKDFNLPDSIKVLNAGNYNLHIAKHQITEKYGILDDDGNIHTRFIYDKIYPFYDELALAYNASKCGYLNLEGEVQIPFEYVIGDHFKNGKAVVSKKFINGVIDKQNDVVIEFKYNALLTHDHNTYHFQLEPRKSGLMDKNEQIIVDPEYDVFVSKNDSLWVGRKKGKFIIYNNEGALHNELEFDQIGKANSAGLSRCMSNGLIGFLDEHFNTKIEPQYKKTGPAVGNLIAVSKGNKFGFINQDNVWEIDSIYDKVQYLNNNACVVIKKGKSNILTTDGSLVFDTEPKYIKGISNSDLVYVDGFIYDAEFRKVNKEKVTVKDASFHGMENGLMKVYRDKNLGYMDSLGKMKIPFMYDEGDHFYEEKNTAVTLDGKWGFIDQLNNKLTDIVFDTVMHYGSLRNCNYIIKQENLSGVFKGNELLVEPSFDEIIVYGQSNLIFRKDEAYSVIDKRTNTLRELPYKILEADDFGYLVEQEDKYGFLDTNFEITIPLAYDTLIHVGYFLIAKKDGKFGTLSDNNVILEQFRFDEIFAEGLGLIKTRIGDKHGLLGESGRVILKTKYDVIKKIDWKNVEVTEGKNKKIINIANFE